MHTPERNLTVPEEMMSRSGVLLETTCLDVFRLVSNREYDDAVAELTGLTDPISAAFVIACVVEGLRPAISRKIVEALRFRLDLLMDERAAQGLRS